MKINEALKKERLSQHKTQTQWIKRLDMSLSHYSEIESGYKKNGKKADIDSEDLMILLKDNYVDIGSFFASVQDSYDVDTETTRMQELFKELTIAFDNRDYNKAEQIRQELLQTPNAPESLRYTAFLITSDLKDNMVSLDKEIKDRIDKYMYQTEDWLNDSNALIIFGNSIPVLKEDILITKMGQLLRKYRQISDFPKIEQIRISSIIMNYLYDAILLRKIDNYVDDIFQLINSLPADENFGFKKIIARYLKDVREGNDAHNKELQTILIRSGLKTIADRLFI